MYLAETALATITTQADQVRERLEQASDGYGYMELSSDREIVRARQLDIALALADKQDIDEVRTHLAAGCCTDSNENIGMCPDRSYDGYYVSHRDRVLRRFEQSSIVPLQGLKSGIVADYKHMRVAFVPPEYVELQFSPVPGKYEWRKGRIEQKDFYGFQTFGMRTAGSNDEMLIASIDDVFGLLEEAKDPTEIWIQLEPYVRVLSELQESLRDTEQDFDQIMFGLQYTATLFCNEVAMLKEIQLVDDQQ